MASENDGKPVRTEREVKYLEALGTFRRAHAAYGVARGHLRRAERDWEEAGRNWAAAEAVYDDAFDNYDDACMEFVMTGKEQPCP